MPRTQDALAELCALLAPADPAVAAEVLLARDAPRRYEKKYAAALEDRFSDEPEPWLALVIALDRRGLSCSLDENPESTELAAGIANVLKKHRGLLATPAAMLSFFDPTSDDLPDDTDDKLRLFGRGLSAHGLALVEIDFPSDSLELTVVRLADLRAAQQLAKSIGEELVSWAPKKPLAAPLAPSKQRSQRLSKVPKPKTLRISGDVYLDDKCRVPAAIGYQRFSKATLIHRLAAWPPSKEVAPKGHVAESAAGDRVVSYQLHLDDDGKVQGQLLARLGKAKEVDLAAKVPAGFVSGPAGFVGSTLVLLPGLEGLSRSSIRRPLVWTGTAFEPARGLRDLPAKNPSSALKQGFARTGNGEEVLLWGEEGFIEKRGQFVAAFKLGPLRGVGNDLYLGVPAPGDAFDFLAIDKKQTLRRVEKGKPPETTFAHLGEPYFACLTATPDGGLVARKYRQQAAEPLLTFFYPDSGDRVNVPGAAFGIPPGPRGLVQAIAVSVDKRWLCLGLSVQIVAQPWAAIAALRSVAPRAKPKKP